MGKGKKTSDVKERKRQGKSTTLKSTSPKSDEPETPETSDVKERKRQGKSTTLKSTSPKSDEPETPEIEGN